jgi:hypothetical protein
MNKSAASKADWQSERAGILHRACGALQSAVQAGKPVCKSLQLISRRYHGRPFKADPSRRLQLSPLTLRRAWNAWRRGGEVPSAVRLKFRPAVPAVPAPLLVRFAEFCASTRQPSFKTAWQRFTAKGSTFGRGRRAGQPPKVSLAQVRHHFGVGNFYRMQASLCAIQEEQLKLARLRLKVTADLRHRLPDKLPGRRVNREINFEI